MSNSNPPIVSCPTCQKRIAWEEKNKFRPFCCERCKLIDLGAWAAEQNKIPGDPINAELNMLDNDSFLH